MKLLMMSMLLLSFLPVICSGHRAPPGRRTPYLSKGQIRRICEEITDLKEADEDLKKANEELIKANEDLKKDNEYLKEATIDLQNRISAIESSSNAPVDGHWTGWLPWSGCYDVDGTGQKTRQRLCLDPRPSNGGTDCVEIDTEQMECELPGGEEKIRWRVGGWSCKPSNQLNVCTTSVTEVDGHWTGWLPWSGCYDVDGTGQKTRQRLCLDPRPSNGGTDCVGIDTEQMECELPGGEEYKSAFAVSYAVPTSTDADPSGVIAWPSGGIKANVGADYDPATGLYTAPHDGTYAFHANIYKDQEVSDFVYCKIVLGDGSLLAAANVPGTAGYHVGTGSIIIHLYRGDTVAVDCSNVYNVNRFSSWMGYLVIAD